MNNLDQRLARIFAAVFGLKSIDAATSIETVEDWDSVSHMTLVLELEKEFGVPFTTDEAVEMTSVPEIKKVLAAKGTGG
jgi:acyl carrier protein